MVRDIFILQMNIALNIYIKRYFCLYIHINTHKVLKASPLKQRGKNTLFWTHQKLPQEFGRNISASQLKSIQRVLEMVFPGARGWQCRAEATRAPLAQPWHRGTWGGDKVAVPLCPPQGGWHSSCIGQHKGGGEIILVSCRVSSFYIFLHKPV